MSSGTYHSERLKKAEQFLQECAGWQRTLDFLNEESFHLKNRLSEMVDHKTDRDFLNEAELYQSQFIQKDEFAAEMAKDIKQQEIKLKENIKNKILPEEKLLKHQQKLRNEISYLEKEFLIMKNDFYREVFKQL